MSRHVPTSAARSVGTLTPFLYPALPSTWIWSSRCRRHVASGGHERRSTTKGHRSYSAFSAPSQSTEIIRDRPAVDVTQYDHLDPVPPEYSSRPFTDACSLTASAGGGGHGCISFLREKFIANGPPNGGDGGTGGSVYIQAVKGETSLHKLARRGILKAGRGKNGEGSSKGGARGEDVLITVPVGTIVREISREDPMDDEEARYRKARRFRSGRDTGSGESADLPQWQREKWLIYPGTLPRSFSGADFPTLPRPRRSSLAASQPPAPLRLDLDEPMDAPMLLVAGAMGGLGNPHFVTKSVKWPKFATKGDGGATINLQLELKLLADVGLVGLPNAGKSTLLRSITNSRTRVGNWAFTTLNPNIGTVVLDSHVGRPALDIKGRRKEPRTSFSIADIPGLIEDAHLDRGLGLGFLRHIERAAVLAFVVDLSAGDATQALKALWREVGEFESLRESELNAETQRLQPPEDGVVSASPSFHSKPDNPHYPADGLLDAPANRDLSAITMSRISGKPWLVIATKADLPETQQNFIQLQNYLRQVQAGNEDHPSGKPNAWRRQLHSVPVSAINKAGVADLPNIILNLLGG